MKTRHFLMMATLAVGIAMTSMMMTSCSKADNPVDTPMDSPNVLPVGVILENDEPCQFEYKGEWRNERVRMQYRVIDQGENPKVELISVDLLPYNYKLFIPDSVVGYWGEEYKVTKIRLRDFNKDKSGLVELYMNKYVKDIGGSFKRCTHLKKVYLPGVDWIRQLAFMKCTSLEELHLYSPWIRIEEEAFEGCENLKYVIFHSNRPHYEQIWFPEGVEFFTEEQWNDRNQGN